MTRFGYMLMLCSIVATTGGVAADQLIEPGQWKVTSSTVVNGAATPPQVKARCLSPEQAEDVARTFGPQSGTINSTCEPAQYETNGRTLRWRLQCRGQLDMDVGGDFNFDSPQHYTATITSRGRMAGALVSDLKTELEADRIGECTQ